MRLRYLLPSALLAMSALSLGTPALAQIASAPQQRDIVQGEQCLSQMERDAQGAIHLARNMLAREDASDVARMMALACLVRSQLMTGEGAQAQAAVPELLPLLESTEAPQQLRVEMRLFTATALQEFGQLRLAGEVLEAALAESEPYTNLHLQALVGVALHHARGMGDPAGAEPYFQRAIATTLKRPGGQLPRDAIPYFNYGLAVLEQGRADEAADLLETAAALAGRDRHLDRLRGRIEAALGRIALGRGDLATAHRQLESAVTLLRELNDVSGLAASLRQLAELALLEGEPARALEYGSEAAGLVESGQLADQVHDSLTLMARIHSALGDATESRAMSERARQHLARINRDRDPAIAAMLEQRAPRSDETIERLGNLTRARVIGAMALLALAATLLGAGWMLLRARRSNRRLEWSSTTDTLTGLANRRAATRQLEALAGSTGRGDARAALLLVDIDHFKAVNDQYGHGEGDRALEAIARTLKQACDANDVVARWGGEEFLIVRPRTSQAAARALAEHLRATLEQLVIPLRDGQSMSVTVSIGLALCPYFPGQGDWQESIRMADRALYAAKHSGRNAWAGTWGEPAGINIDVYSVRQDPQAALANGWISVSGSRPISWTAPRTDSTGPVAAPARGQPPRAVSGQDRTRPDVQNR